MAKNKLLFFYGDECPHCHEMEPHIEKLEKEEGVKFQKLEVWHNSKNAKKFAELDQGECGAVPYFYNKETEEGLCGEVSYKKLKKWALKGKKE